MKKIVLFLSLLFLVSGCSINYNLEFSGEDILEEIDFSLTESEYDEWNSNQSEKFEEDGYVYFNSQQLLAFSDNYEELHKRILNRNGNSYDVNYSYKYNDLYVITTYLEYKGLWQDYMNEETFNKISEETFNEYNLLAIYRRKGSSAGYDIGYKNFFVDGDGIHITLDEGEEYMGDCMIYEWYSMVLIPKSYFKNGYDYDEIDICINLIHHNYKWGYGY